MARKPPEPEHEVDLHGMDVDSATRRLASEFAFCRARSISPVLVITGRGHGSPDGKGVLGPAVRRWLDHEGRALGVLEWRPMHRGGALWVRIGTRDA